MNYKLVVSISILIIIVLIVYFKFICTFTSSKDIKDEIKDDIKSHRNNITKCVVINMDKNDDRLEYVNNQFNMSDLSKSFKLERFPAIVGKSLDINKYLTPEAKQELYETEYNGYRTKHHQLSRGAIGCYLSHISVMKDIKPNETYLILEDDVNIDIDVESKIKNILDKAPADWDIILLGHSHYLKDNSYNDPHNNLNKAYSYWGMFGYLINYKGAQKVLSKSSKIDGQIDSVISWNSDSINIYVVKKPIIIHSYNFDTNAQNNIKELPNKETYIYRNKILQYPFSDKYTLVGTPNN
jgi:GR25 family glycosyltransferase involved in LPS biosynthesis